MRCIMTAFNGYLSSKQERCREHKEILRKDLQSLLTHKENVLEFSNNKVNFVDDRIKEVVEELCKE
ncbi:hypothetical protein Bhyg_06004 [Pseudolycoriella hygida]|uniref:Uncharacterized protein n=1 Tax=Pseudolycoriella hygida TaxID=35572 RepID=A0A9Q0S2I5_9DIPT|nr:hypothetical protein Bhyg_06004 [Pseudolycoriella hygida]